MTYEQHQNRISARERVLAAMNRAARDETEGDVRYEIEKIILKYKSKWKL